MLKNITCEMKYLKTYEQKQIILPEIGDYVICDPNIEDIEDYQPPGQKNPL